jgi:hypothetical protein
MCTPPYPGERWRSRWRVEPPCRSAHDIRDSPAGRSCVIGHRDSRARLSLDSRNQTARREPWPQCWMPACIRRTLVALYSRHASRWACSERGGLACRRAWRTRCRGALSQICAEPPVMSRRPAPRSCDISGAISHPGTLASALNAQLNSASACHAPSTAERTVFATSREAIFDFAQVAIMYAN